MRVFPDQDKPSLDELSHYGVKGMRWGVRKSDDSKGRTSGPVLKEKTKDLSFTLKNGDKLTLSGRPTSRMTKFMARVNPSKIEEYNTRETFKIKDKTGKSVGEMFLHKDRELPNALNVSWVGIDDSARGNGYATAAMRSAVQHAKDSNYDKVTLEVPGNSPDARHIYEKLGFKEVYTPPEMAEDDPVWGGLTKMELDLKPKRSR